MADEQKPTPVAETVPATEPVAETKPEETVAPATEAAPAATEDKPAEETPAAEATETPATEAPAAAAEETKEEAKPVRPVLWSTRPPRLASPSTYYSDNVGAGFEWLTNRDRNIIYSKNHFWFGSEPVTSDKLATYLKHEKATDVAHHVVSWASETGKGLLFYAKESDKSTPTGVIQLVCCS